MESTLISQALNIRYIDLKFTLMIQKNGILPKFKTSALRGGMGQMLLKQNCIRDERCECCGRCSPVGQNDKRSAQP